jgi:RNA polymerase sigma-70 factor (ECF subfamily)
MNFDEQLQRHRPILSFEAKRIHQRKLQARFDPSDVVQQTLIEAHQQRNAFAGDNSVQMAGWLLKMLKNNMIDAVRGNHREKNDVDREQPVTAIQRSSIRLGAVLAASQSTPSEQAMQHERLLALTAALEQLPENWQTVVRLKHFERRSLKEVAAEMNTTQPAVAGMLFRALERLRMILESSSDFGATHPT